MRSGKWLNACAFRQYNRRCFLATCSGVLTLHWLVELKHNTGSFLSVKLGLHRDFGLYNDSEANYGSQYWYYLWEVPMYVLLGVLGGLMGALFVRLNKALTKYRQRKIPVSQPFRRLLEVIVVATVTNIINFMMTYFSACDRLPDHVLQYASKVRYVSIYIYVEYTRSNKFLCHAGGRL